MELAEKYGVEVVQDFDTGGLLLIDADSHVVAVMPLEWTQSHIEAFLDGREVGMRQGREQGEDRLRRELRRLLGVPPAAGAGR